MHNYKVADSRVESTFYVVVLTTSRSNEDIVSVYGLGASSFITKPVTFEGLCNMVKALSHYWCEIVILPPECRSNASLIPTASISDSRGIPFF